MWKNKIMCFKKAGGRRKKVEIIIKGKRIERVQKIRYFPNI